MNWENLDWAALDRLREGFLSGPASGESYWKSESDLACYDLTFGERIGWKWDQVLRELKMRAWTPFGAGRAPDRAGRPTTVLDWGCGSGIAGRRAVSFLGEENVDELSVWDRSPMAAAFATDAATRAFPKLRVSQVTQGFLNSNEPIGILVASHVLNELAPEARAELLATMARADAVIWVEPGTHDISRELGALRERLREDFCVVAPCTHEDACPMLSAENERHWCHFFAPSPAGVLANPDWVKFGQRAGIDLRSLPYCFLALERKIRDGSRPDQNTSGSKDTGLSRIIGRPEHFKPYARLLNCDASGLAELTVPRRSSPSLYKELERNRAPLVYRWRREGPEIASGEAVGGSR